MLSQKVKIIKKTPEEFLTDKKAKPFLALDIGTSAVKCLIFFRDDKKNNTILGSGLEYYDKYNVFDTGDFKIEVIRKTISRAIEASRKSMFFSLASKELKKKAQKQKKWPILLGLPPNILKARIIEESFLRKDPKEKISKNEVKKIKKQVFESAKKRISHGINRNSGILSADIYWTSLKIVGIKIDGYPVSDCVDYQGKIIDFRILVSFLPVSYLENVKKIFNSLLFKNLKIIHAAEFLSEICRNKEKDGLWIDLGGDITQIFEIENNQLQWISDFEGGGELFINALSRTLGMDESGSRFLLERYLKKNLSSEATGKIREIFRSERKIWYDNLKNALEKEKSGVFNIFLFGGAGFIPEIKEVLEENGLNNINFFGLKDFKNIKDVARMENYYQYVSILLLMLN